MTSVFNVLFLCTGNSARSILAEAILNQEGEGRFRAFSAGSMPAKQVHPYALDLLSNLAIPVEGLVPKHYSAFTASDAPVMHFVFTVCDRAAEEVCPVWPGQPITAHWGVPDPAGVTGLETERRFAFADCYRMLRNRIRAFVSLPVSKLDRMALTEHVVQIGRTVDSDSGEN